MSTVFAFIATYALVLQMLLGSVLLGSAVAAPTLDDFGNPLCITHAENAGQPDRDDNTRLPQCCTQACSVLLPAVAAQAADNFLINRLGTTERRISAKSETGPFQRPETSPGNPRAPPRMA